MTVLAASSDCSCTDRNPFRITIPFRNIRDEFVDACPSSAAVAALTLS